VTCHYQENDDEDSWLEQLRAPWKGHKDPQNGKASNEPSLSYPLLRGPFIKTHIPSRNRNVVIFYLAAKKK
jgi:hypothetical protein